jgi:hypothetical protein
MLKSAINQAAKTNNPENKNGLKAHSNDNFTYRTGQCAGFDSARIKPKT